MKKILIVAYYDLKDFFINIKESLESFNYKVFNYPLFRYAYDSNDKLINYNEHMNKYVKEINPDIILWWFIDVPPDIFTYIKKNNPTQFYILFNCDEVMNMSADLLKKAQNFNLVITPTKENFLKYKVHGKINHILHNFCGYDPEYFRKIDETEIEEDDDQYRCDISMVCDNLLLDKNYYNAQYINRVEFINNLIVYCEKKGKIFKLYGPPSLKEFYSDYYKGEIQYIKLNILYNLSKIVINTHSFSNKSQYLNDQTMQILGSGGLLMIDKTKEIDKILKDNENCIFLEKINYIEQIDEILSNYEKYKSVRENAIIFSKKYTWYEWVKKLHVEISRKHFDEETYKELYEVQGEKDPWEHWLENGIHKNHVCHNFHVPDNFQADEYSNKYNLTNNSKKKLFAHWNANSKDEIFLMEKSNNLMLNMNECFVTTEDFYTFSNICNKIFLYNTKDKGIDELNEFSKHHPYSDINKLLELYYKTIE